MNHQSPAAPATHRHPSRVGQIAPTGAALRSERHHLDEVRLARLFGNGEMLQLFETQPTRTSSGIIVVVLVWAAIIGLAVFA